MVSLHSPPRKDQQDADLELSFLFVCIFSVFASLIHFTFRFVDKFMFIHPFIRSDNRHFVFYIFKDIVIVLFLDSFSNIKAFQVFLNSDLCGCVAWNGERAFV